MQKYFVSALLPNSHTNHMLHNIMLVGKMSGSLSTASSGLPVSIRTRKKHDAARVRPSHSLQATPGAYTAHRLPSTSLSVQRLCISAGRSAATATLHREREGRDLFRTASGLEAAHRTCIVSQPHFPTAFHTLPNTRPNANCMHTTSIMLSSVPSCPFSSMPALHSSTRAFYPQITLLGAALSLRKCPPDTLLTTRATFSTAPKSHDPNFPSAPTCPHTTSYHAQHPALGPAYDAQSKNPTILL